MLIIAGLGLFNIIIHLIFHGKLEHHRDELLYFSLGMHPAAGYATIPPLIGWIAGILQLLFGYSLFVVKLFPAVLGGAFVVLTAAVTKELGGKGYAQILSAIAVIIMPVMIRTFHLFQPVSIDLFFWTLIFYLTLRYINTEKDNYLISLGAVFGLAMMNKYLVALLLAGLLVSILFTRHNVIFTKKTFYLGLGIGFLIFLPNLIWQITHGLPVINHMQELNESQLVNVSRIDFLFDQFVLSYVSFLIMLLGFLYLWKEKQYRFLMSTVLFVIIALLILQGKSYYTIGVFPILTAAGSIFIEKMFRNKLARFGIPALFVLLTLPILPYGMPIYDQEGMITYFQKVEDKYGLTLGRRFEDGTIHTLPQDYADQLGWEELALLTSKAYEKIPAKEKALIFADNYGYAGAVSVIGKKYDLPEAISFSDAFAYWMPTKFTPNVEYFIYINTEISRGVNALFDEVEVIGQVSNVNAREYGATVFLCSKPNRPFNEFWQEVLDYVSENE